MLLFLLPLELKIIASDIWSPLGILMSLVIIRWSIKHFERNEDRRIWILCFLGNLSFLFGDLTWFYYEIIKGLEVPYPSIADFFYILTPLFYFAASIIFIRRRGLYLSIRTAIDIIIMMTVSTTLEWEFVFKRLINDIPNGIFNKFISIIYPVSDLTLLFITIFIYFNYYLRDENNYHSKILIAAPLVWIFCDQIYIVKSNLASYLAGDFIDPLWTLVLILLSICSIYNVEFNLQDSKQAKYNNRKNNVSNYIGVLLPYLVIIILLIISSQYINWTPLLIGSYSTILLIIIRQIFTILDDKRLLDLLYKTNAELENNKKKLEEVNSKLIQVNSSIEQEARTDFLTKLYNRRFIEETLNALIIKANRDELIFALMILDIDHFKKVNDIYGHDAGDMVLKDLALIMTSTVRSEDVIGRWGGEEFIIIKSSPVKEDINIMKEIAERIRSAVESHVFCVSGNSFSITVSVGVTTWVNKYDDINSLIRRADNALYKAKNTGRNKVVVE